MRGNSIIVALAVVANPIIASAQISSQAAKQVQAVVTRSFASGEVPAVGQAPNSAAARVVPVNFQSDKGVITFKQAADLLAEKGLAKQIAPTFCSRFDLDCGGQPWPVRQKGAKSDKDAKSAFIGKLSGNDTVVMIRQDNDKTKAEVYVCDANGTFVRGFSIINNGTPNRLSADQAKAGFESEKQWWMNWLPENTIATAATTASN